MKTGTLYLDPSPSGGRIQVAKPWQVDMNPEVHLKFTVPQGFICDGASAHFLPDIWLHDTEQGAVAHDYIYRNPKLFPDTKRRVADRVWRLINIYSGVESPRAWVLWLGVRTTSWAAWRRYRAKQN
jgi:hypothetical protein